VLAKYDFPNLNPNLFDTACELWIPTFSRTMTWRGRIDHVDGGNRFGFSLPSRRSNTASPISRMVDGSSSSHLMSMAIKTLVRRDVKSCAKRRLSTSRRYVLLQCRLSTIVKKWSRECDVGKEFTD